MRHALPVFPHQFLAKSEAPWIEPATAVEEKLAVLYREVLSLDRLSTKAAFCDRRKFDSGDAAPHPFSERIAAPRYL
jgi:hypothetical protein